MWAACVLYMWPLNRRSRFGMRFLVMVLVGGVTLFAVSVAFLEYPVLLAPCHLLICAAGVYFCCAVPAGDAVYCAAWAMITQQVAYEITYILEDWLQIAHPLHFAGVVALVFTGIYVVAAVTIGRYMPERGVYHVGPRQLSSALFLLVVFELLFSFLKDGDHSEVSGRMYTWNVLLVQCYCVTILYLQNTLFKKSAMKQELDTLNQLWHQQKEQYELSRETISLINHKCHDLKHQIAAMRAITSPEEREKYLREVEESVQIYDSIVKTGNEVLDTVLTEKSLFCAANNIKINCIADGRRMDVMDPVDLYTVFGNALDNAIESVKQLENREMRMIDVLVYVRQQFLMINIMNPIGNRVEFEGELPVSTKTKNGYHGFGLKSIRHTVGKYNGFMKIDTAENIFSLKILMPLR